MTMERSEHHFFKFMAKKFFFFINFIVPFHFKRNKQNKHSVGASALDSKELHFPTKTTHQGQFLSQACYSFSVFLTLGKKDSRNT